MYVVTGKEYTFVVDSMSCIVDGLISKCQLLSLQLSVDIKASSCFTGTTEHYDHPCTGHSASGKCSHKGHYFSCMYTTCVYAK